MKIKEYIKKMKSTYQIEGKQTIYEHELDVAKCLEQVIEESEDPSHILNDFIPFLYDKKTLSRYAKYHDIGKTICFAKDEKG